jgi:hypothetical protein
MLSSVWARSCFWIAVSTLNQIFPHPLFLFTLYFIIIIITFLLLYFHIQTLRWVALGLWSVCSPVHRSRWSDLSFWHSCEPAFKILLYILAPESVLHIPVYYYLSVYNSDYSYLHFILLLLLSHFYFYTFKGCIHQITTKLFI